MKRKSLLLLFLSLQFCIGAIGDVAAQQLKIKPRRADAKSGQAFALSISDSTLSLKQRERIIYREIKSGNVPDFLRKLKKVTHIENEKSISFFVLPDYLAIGNDTNYCYMPMTPILAQKIANLSGCSLPTKKMVDLIYRNAEIKLNPQPLPPTKAMVTLPVFMTHNDTVASQLKAFSRLHQQGALTVGHKKDVVISTKIYTENSPKVVIYGWHQSSGKPIQPMYNKHSITWADYSHGIRLVQTKMIISDHTKKMKKILADPKLCVLLSDEGMIKKTFYPISENY